MKACCDFPGVPFHRLIHLTCPYAQPSPPLGQLYRPQAGARPYRSLNWHWQKLVLTPRALAVCGTSNTAAHLAAHTRVGWGAAHCRVVAEGEKRVARVLKIWLRWEWVETLLMSEQVITRVLWYDCVHPELWSVLYFCNPKQIKYLDPLVVASQKPVTKKDMVIFFFPSENVRSLDLTVLKWLYCHFCATEIFKMTPNVCVICCTSVAVCSSGCVVKIFVWFVVGCHHTLSGLPITAGKTTAITQCYEFIIMLSWMYKTGVFIV